MKNVANTLMPEYLFIDKNAPSYSNFLNTKSEMLIPFLGLKDKNGKLICFGDILIDNMQNLLIPVVKIENNEHILFFKPIKHLNNPLLNIGCKSAYSNTLEIRGNIYTNPNLFLLIKEYNNLPQEVINIVQKEILEIKS